MSQSYVDGPVVSVRKNFDWGQLAVTHKLLQSIKWFQFTKGLIKALTTQIHISVDSDFFFFYSNQPNGFSADQTCIPSINMPARRDAVYHLTCIFVAITKHAGLFEQSFVFESNPKEPGRVCVCVSHSLPCDAVIRAITASRSVRKDIVNKVEKQLKCFLTESVVPSKKQKFQCRQSVVAGDAVEASTGCRSVGYKAEGSPGLIRR